MFRYILVLRGYEIKGFNDEDLFDELKYDGEIVIDTKEDKVYFGKDVEDLEELKL